MRNRIILLCIVVCSGLFEACDYLDVVHDNIATIDNAFTSRAMAEKFLFTCYSYMPAHADINSQAFTIGDEFWLPYPQNSDGIFNNPFEQIARGNQSVVSPCLNYWDGLNGGKPMFTALRDCNIFLERMDGDIPGLDEYEKTIWKAEVKFLKAYYHYWLLRMYGPIPLIKENLPVSASITEVQVKREPVDACFDYIVELLDEAIPDLLLKVDNEATEMGRATQPIALAVKAKALVEAASPLFNGNTDYATFKRKDGVQYFNQTFDPVKWQKAATACKNAIDTCHLAGFSLFKFVPGPGDNLPPALVTEMSIRNSVAEGNLTLNKEPLWINPNSMSRELQRQTTARADPSKPMNNGVRSSFGVPMKIVEMFYTKNGVPIEEDEEWASKGTYLERYNLKTVTSAYKYNLAVGMETALLNFDREIRYYANLAFDGGLWYGLGAYDPENQHIIHAKKNQHAGDSKGGVQYSVTGYYCKKIAWYRNILLSGDGAGYTIVDYPWPVIRLADLYLLYSEALNEVNEQPSPEVYKWIDEVRDRCGLEGVVDSWSKYAVAQHKSKPSTKNGFREIIRRERLIELANEGLRYWELRRWKTAREILHQQPIQGWDTQKDETAPYYNIRTVFTPKFFTKDYFWPIREYNLSVNRELDQNPGW